MLLGSQAISWVTRNSPGVPVLEPYLLPVLLFSYIVSQSDVLTVFSERWTLSNCFLDIRDFWRKKHPEDSRTRQALAVIWVLNSGLVLSETWAWFVCSRFASNQSSCLNGHIFLKKSWEYLKGSYPHQNDRILDKCLRGGHCIGFIWPIKMLRPSAKSFSFPVNLCNIAGDLCQDHVWEPKLEQALCTNLHPLPMGHKLNLHSPPTLL